MTKILWLFFFLLYPSLGFSESKMAPKYGPQATRLFLQHQFIQKATAPDFWALSPYYVHQQTGSACSVASAVMVLNGIRAPESLGSSMELFTQNFILEITGNKNWKRAVSNQGGGTTLQELQGYLTQSLEKLKLEKWRVEVVFAENSADFKKKMKELLTENEKTDRNFLIANFLQSELTGDPEGSVGHFAPIAAYDSSIEQVLILDPDRNYYEPYWVKLDALFSSLNSIDRTSKKKRGLLWVQKVL